MLRRFPAKPPQLLAITAVFALLSATALGDTGSETAPPLADVETQSPPTAVPQTQPVETTEAEELGEVRPVPIDLSLGDMEPVSEPASGMPPFEFWPPLTGPTLTWFAVVVILVLTLRARPLLSERNLDGLVLAATCLLLTLRLDLSDLPDWAAGQTVQWWSYLLLTVAAGYWLLRGLLCVGARVIPRPECNVSRAALLVLTLAGLGICIHRIATEPLSAGSRDGLVGGLCTMETGRLPYGEAAGHDRRSPLLYLLHAGAVALVPPTYLPPDANVSVNMSWENRAAWMETEWWRSGDVAPARLVSALLFVLLIVAMYLVGARLHSPDIGLTMVAVLCVFPGAVECLARPEIMLPTTLLAWSMVGATLPGVGGLLAALLMVLAGVAWPWAWLGLPLLLGYFLRSGPQTLGGLAGLLVGTVATVAALTWLTSPSLPRADGALHRAGLEPSYTINRGDDGILRITKREPAEQAQTGLLRWFWKFLVTSENLVMDTMEYGPGRSQVYAVDDLDPRTLLYRRIAPTEGARAELTDRYRSALRAEPVVTHIWVALRTVLEQTWLSPLPPDPELPSNWRLWSAGAAGGGAWPTVRKIAEVVALVIVLITSLALLRRSNARPAHLMGGLLVMSATVLLADYAGAVTNLIWLLPAALAVWAAYDEPAPEQPGVAERVAARLNPAALGPAPRITVEE